jgi:hypothetical protein
MPSLSRDEARRLGYSEAEIDAYLEANPDIVEELAAPQAGGGDLVDLGLQAIPPTMAGLGGVGGTMLGGMAGGVGALPGGLIGAGLGGSAGEWARQQAAGALGRGGGDPAANLGRIPMEGIKQMIAEGGGRLLGSALKPMATHLMRSGLRPSVGLQRAFPDVDIAEAAVAERIPAGRVTPWTQQGSSKAGRLLKGAVAGRAEALEAAREAGARSITLRDIMREASGPLAMMRRQARDLAEVRDIDNAVASLREKWATQKKFTPKELEQMSQEDVAAALNELVESALKGKEVLRFTRRMDPTSATRFKQTLQRGALRAYRAAEKGPLAPNIQAKADVDRELAAATRRLVEARSSDAGVKTIQKLNQRVQRLMAVKEAARAVELRVPPRLKLNEPGTYPFIGPLMGDEMMTRYALGVDSPLARILATQGPRGVAFMFGGAPPEETQR